MAKAYLLAPSLIFCLAASVRAQAPVQSNAHYTLRGSVVNSVTGEPIHKASVSLNGSQSNTTLTGPDGQFEFAGLQAGTYYVNANRPGYVDVTMNGGPVLPLQLGPDTGPLTVKLTPLGRIAGHVVDTDGDPVPNLSVQSLQRMQQNGHVTWQPSGAGETDENGNYALDMLQPGQYLVATVNQEVYPGFAGDDRASRLSYRRQYYPNSPDLTAAQPIEVAGGESVQADLTVSEIVGARVSFSVVPPQAWVGVMLRDANGEELHPSPRRDGRSGGWLLSGVPPGSWHLEADSNSDGQQLSGSALIEVGDSDVKNVVVALAPPLQVPIIFSGDSQPANAAPPANVMLIPSSNNRSNSYGTNSVNQAQGGHFAILGVTPGRYHVQIGPNPSQCVASVSSGASDLARVDYVVPDNGAAQPITVAVGTDCGTVEFSPKQKSGPFFFVVITGGVHALEPLLLIGGDNVTAKLAPGEYDAYAFANANAVEYANPDVLKNFVSRHISVSSNQNASMKLDLNTTEGK